MGIPLYDINLSNYIEIKPMLWDDDVINVIAKERMLHRDKIRTVLRYNVLSFKQVALLCGVTESRIRNGAVKILKKNGELHSTFTVCDPFPDLDGGKLFILVDDRCINYIKKCNGISSDIT